MHTSPLAVLASRGLVLPVVGAPLFLEIEEKRQSSPPEQHLRSIGRQFTVMLTGEYGLKEKTPLP
jgi:hypothetical protein